MFRLAEKSMTCRRQKIAISVVVALMVLLGAVFAYRRYSASRFIGAWKEVQGGAFGPRRILTFLPDGTINDTAFNENGWVTGSGVEWQWWASGEMLFIRSYQAPTGRNWLTTSLDSAFDEFYRLTSRRPQNDESAYRIMELTSRKIVLDEVSADRTTRRRLIFERVD